MAVLKPVCIVFNPTARGEGAVRARAYLESIKDRCALKPTLAAGDARTLTREAICEGYGTIVAMGGDGTVNEVINGVGDHPDGFAQVRLGVLPVGTVNVFARELNIPLTFQRAWDVICRGRERCVDVLHMTYQSAAGQQNRWFIQMAGCGLDARAVELMDWKLKKSIGQFAYVVSGLKALREPRPKLLVRNGLREYRGELVLMGNGRFYGGSIPIFRQASLQDGLLDVMVFPRVNWFVVLRYACAFLSPKLMTYGREEYLQSASIQVESHQVGPVPVEVDGEALGHVPVLCSVGRQALRVVVP